MSKAKKCDACGRDPERVNSAWSECSRIECPSRRKSWSERPSPSDLFRGPWPKNIDADPNPLDAIIKDDKA